jgi:tight adherence protein C
VGNFASGSGNWIIAIWAAAAGLFFLGITVMVGRVMDPARRRLEQLASATATPSAPSAMGELLKPFARLLLPAGGTERSAMTEKLRYAGYTSDSAVQYLYAIKGVLGLGLPLIWYGCSRFFPTLSTGRIFFFALAAAFVGMLLPNKWLDRRVAARQKSLRNGFPDALDMLTVCVESGLGLAAAIQRVADELEISHPELAMELAQVNAQMRAGVERETALRGLAERTGLDDIRGLVGLLVQTLRFGTGVADALRVYANEFRDKRMQRAEEAAAKMGTKLIFPLVLCLFPCFFVVAIGPAVIRLVEAFSGH